MITIAPLPYSQEALMPYISGTTISYHYGKHEKGYVDSLNALIADTKYDNLDLITIIKKSHREKRYDIFNMAAQIWNHDFYWQCMKLGGSGEPMGNIAEAINRDFGSYKQFITEFKEVALSQFGSGWAWLVYRPLHKKLSIIKTSNADTPIILYDKKCVGNICYEKSIIPLLTIDVWEHAYYIDYQNLRSSYCDAIINNLINWDFASDNFAKISQS